MARTSFRHPHDRSLRFYLGEIGLHGDASSQEWGYRIDLQDGFMLALIRGVSSTGASHDVHFGCVLEDGASARELRRRLHERGIPEIVWEDTADYVGVKVADPDGYVVELAYEPR